ncbi:MAG TPA: hypothetical protein VFB63_21635 [Bryobacteraceae bacterium]|nr:hypothetical protein [Bryobacteraceae bacterium]
MIALLLLLAAAANEKVTLFDDVIKVPRSQWRGIRLDLQQRPATIEVSHEVLRGRSAIRVVLMTSEDVARFGRGESHRVLAASPFLEKGKFRYSIVTPANYQVLLDNRLEGRGASEVKVKIDVAFDERLSFTPRELPAETRRQVVLWSLSGFAAICTVCGWALFSALRSRKTPPPDPPYV